MPRSLVRGLAATLLAAPAAYAQIEVMSDGRIVLADGNDNPGYSMGAVHIRRNQHHGD